MRTLALLLLVGLSCGCRSADHYYRRGLHTDHPRLKVEYLGEAIRMQPDHLLALRARGGARLEQGEYAGAIEDLDRALELEPDHAPTLALRSTARARSGDLDQAEADLARAMAEGGDALPEVQIRRGVLLEKRGKPEDAAEAYSAAIRLAPKSGEAHHLRGRLRFRGGKLEGARADLTRAIEYGDAVISAEARQDLTLTWLAEGQLPRAVEALKAAQRARPELSGRWLYLLGALFYIQDNYETAGACFAEAHVRRYQREYCYLFMTMVSERVYQRDHKELAGKILDSEDLGPWPSPILAGYAGRLDVAGVLAKAKTPGQRAEAAYFLAEHFLLTGDTARAAELLAQAVRSHTDPITPEYHLARLRVNLLRAKAQEQPE